MIVFIPYLILQLSLGKGVVDTGLYHSDLSFRTAVLTPLLGVLLVVVVFMADSAHGYVLLQEFPSAEESHLAQGDTLRQTSFTSSDPMTDQ